MGEGRKEWRAVNRRRKTSKERRTEAWGLAPAWKLLGGGRSLVFCRVFVAGLLFGFGDKEVLSLASGSSERYCVGFISIVASRCLEAA